MTITAIVEALVAAGATPEMILAAVRAAEATNSDALVRRRAKDAERQQRFRDRNVTSRDVTVTERDGPLSERPSEGIFTTLEVNQNSPPYSPPKSEKLASKAKRPKRAYSDAFERFWSGYPTDPNMSKPEAAEEFDRLDADDQARCISAAGPFSTYCAKNPDYRPVHAVRFIRQRRFDGFAQSHAPPPGVPTFETDEDHAKWWEQQMLSRAAQ